MSSRRDERSDVPEDVKPQDVVKEALELATCGTATPEELQAMANKMARYRLNWLFPPPTWEKYGFRIQSIVNEPFVSARYVFNKRHPRHQEHWTSPEESTQVRYDDNEEWRIFRMIVLCYAPFLEESDAAREHDGARERARQYERRERERAEEEKRDLDNWAAYKRESCRGHWDD